MKIKPEAYLRMCRGVSIKSIESVYMYNAVTDDLYEINDEAAEFLVKCDGSNRAGDLSFDNDFVSYCVDEGLINVLPKPAPRPVGIFKSPIPSLRYLELQITYRCNLTCRHCYLGTAREVDMSPDKILEAMEQFEKMGGMRVLISGGEPLMHPEWDRINAEMERFDVRRVLLSNGEFIAPEMAWRLSVQEVQVSIDGMEASHDKLRGKGSWKTAITGAENVIKSGLDLSVATMAHSGNLKEFGEMNVLFNLMGVKEWGIDVPCVSGRLKRHKEILPPIEEAAPLIRYAFGGSYHGGGEGYACGLHLATLTPEGNLLKCGFYPNDPLGTLDEGLEVAWSRSKPIPLSTLDCATCKLVSDCAGGCRYRAKKRKAPDPVMCTFYGGAPK